jgi:hypothetical protein
MLQNYRLDSLIRVTRIAGEVKVKVPLTENLHHGMEQGSRLYAKMFYAQRNVYLTGFTILMAVYTCSQHLSVPSLLGFCSAILPF